MSAALGSPRPKGLDLVLEGNVVLETQSFALIMEDPDAPGGTWTHWVVYNIPNDKGYLKERLPKKGMMFNGIMQGRNSLGTLGYGCPYPPPGPAHRYVFKLYALDRKLNLPPGITKDHLLVSMEGHILDTAELTGTFGRRKVGSI